MKKLGLLVAAVVVAVGIFITVGGWVTNDGNGGNGSASSGDETPSGTTDEENNANQEESAGMVVEKIDYNTDEPYENFTVEIEEYLGKNIIFKVTNNSDVCYKYLSVRLYFTSDPLPNRKPIDGEYSNPYTFWNIPAYSVTYHLCQAFGEEMSSDKGGGYDGRMYYPFDINSDTYRVELEESTKVSPAYGVSDVLLQDASSYLTYDMSTRDLSVNKLGTIINMSNRHVEFQGFVVFADGTATEIQNGSELIDSLYKNIIPAAGVVFETPVDEEYDCNSIYTKPYDYENTIKDYQIYIGSAWFVDEAEQF